MTLWGGRFSEPTADEMRQWNDSLRFDRRLADVDITGSVAWARGLARAGLLDAAEATALVDGLERVRAEFAAGRFVAQPGDEDIHTAVERRLRELVGPLAGKLHTGRSRNDQVATDLRLYTRHAALALAGRVIALQAALLGQAETHAATLLPGYTHLQRAQPVTFGHWCLAYVEMLARDVQRLQQCAAAATSALPLGAGALAGHSLGVPREPLATELGFAAPAANSLDAVADRDFVAELLFAGALLGIHLSRLGEDLILYSSAEFGFVQLADAYSTGSSLMPQKKNPDSMELLRGKSGRLVGNLVAVLTMLKGLPLAYNKDMQEDKEPLFDTLDTLDLGLRVAAAAIASMGVNPERMRAALDDAMLATDLADELVRRGLPFREAHHLAGRLVRLAEEQGVALRDLPAAVVQQVAPALVDDYAAIFSFERAVAQKASFGGTSPEQVRAQVAAWRQRIGVQYP